MSWRSGTTFSGRTAAGRVLAERLSEYAHDPRVQVLGIPRGGVVVAAEVARALHAPLDVLVVRKVGHPGNPEFAAGAVDPDGALILNPAAGVTASQVASIAEHERDEARRRVAEYRRGRPPLRLDGKVALLVDDGIATGLTALKAVGYARDIGAERVVVAAPVMSVDAAERLRAEADEVVAVDTPVDFAAVGQFYRDFPQTTDAEVARALEEAGSDGA